MKIFLTGKHKYKIIYARSNANGAVFSSVVKRERALNYHQLSSTIMRHLTRALENTGLTTEPPDSLNLVSGPQASNYP